MQACKFHGLRKNTFGFGGSIMSNQGHGYDSRCLTSFIEAGERVCQFKKDLDSLGIKVKSGSALDTICRNIMDLENKRQGYSEIALLEDPRPCWQRAVGLIELLKMLNYAAKNGKLELFEPHLRLLNKGTPVQNIIELRDDACNKIFEMHVALFCLPLADKVELEDPSNSSKNKNPDVLATIDGTLWGFACKTPNSANGAPPITLFDNIQKGVDQIMNSKAERGLVYFNFRNVIDHDKTWPATSDSSKQYRVACMQNEDQVNAYLKQLVDETVDSIVNVNGRDNIKKLFEGKNSIPGAMVYLQTTAAILAKVGPCAHHIGQAILMEFDSVSESDRQLLQRIHDARRHMQGLC